MFSNIGGTNKFSYPYTISNSCRFNSADFAYLNRTSVGAVTSKKTFSISLWVKRCELSGSSFMPLFSKYVLAANQVYFNFSNDKLVYYDNPGSVVASFSTDNVFRDTSAWYHVLGVWDSTDGTAADRIKFYVNGVREDVTIATAVALNQDFRLNTEGNTIYMCRYSEVSDHYLGAYLADTYLIDGQALTPSSFGQMVKGVWTPKEYTGTYGLNGFYLDYSNSSDFGEDQSGNANDWTDNNLAVNDQVQDTPTNNVCTFNYVNRLGSTTDMVYANGNLEVNIPGDSTQRLAEGSIVLPKSGNWYFEINIDAIGTPSAQNTYIGIRRAGSGTTYVYCNDGQFYNASSWAAYGATWTTGDVIGIAVNVDDEEITFYKNNTTQGTESISAITGLDMSPIVSLYSTSGIPQFAGDFGQLGFTYAPPTGFKALNTNNIPRLSGTFNKFAVCATENEYSSGTYTGNGSVDGTFVYLGFQPTNVCIDNTNYDGSGGIIDVLSNGFKLRHASTENVNTTSYAYEAWVDKDFKYANAK